MATHEMAGSLGAFEQRMSPKDETSPGLAHPMRANDWESRNVSDCISQIVCVITAQGRGRYFNPYWETYTGLSEGQSLDFGWLEAFHREDLDSFRKLLRSPIEPGGREFEARLKLIADGSYRRHQCRCSVLNDQPDGSTSLLICCTDVEQWRRAEEQSALLGLSLRTHEEEKRKIAHALHDSAGQYLVALQMKLDVLQRSSIAATGRKNPVVDECRELIKRCCREIRATSHLLYPPLLDDLGLETAVRLHLDGFMERRKIRVELDIESHLGRLDRTLEITLFRVVQEALATIHRKCADNAQIKIGGGPTSIFVEVAAPGGVEFSSDKFTPLGRTPELAALRQRISDVGGLFEIANSADGLVIRAVVPRRALVAHACD
jgi:PAS domain S-box-containing protein